MSKTVCLDLDGTMRPQISEETSKLYKTLYNDVVANFDKKILSRFFPLEGKYYNNYESNDDVRLMVVGRSVNGWTALSECTAEEFVNSAANTIIYEGFSWLRDDGKAKDTYIREPDKKVCRYNVNGSSFFRCIKKTLNELNPITKSCDRWFEHIVWSNLYTIAPLHKGNAVGKLQQAQINISKELLIEQIMFYDPTHILFITDWDYWFDAFSDIFPHVEKTGDTLKDNVVGCGKYEKRKIVVTIRPDRTVPTKPSEEDFVKDVIEAFNNIAL